MSKDTTTVTTKTKTVKSAGWLINLLSFASVILIGVSLILTKLGFLESIRSSLMIIAQTIAYFVVTVVSFYYVYRRRRIWVWIAWAVSVVLIVLYYVI